MTDLFTAVVVRAQNTFHALRNREEGQTFVEYAILIGVVGIIVVAGVTIFANDLKTSFTKIGDWVSQNTPTTT